ncbi:carbohydrate sulfotransferase 11-like [Actinia tenebrosa]|uniref:Carbohydrate sulfotransferase n=1 Tax=Actinia tenebrosa TaxID=6105 RepID=A0A6P8IUT3_ACTTE|nr:carbohydrate sulfotransferase 11-like [Actinia tenebrosa]
MLNVMRKPKGISLKRVVLLLIILLLTINGLRLVFTNSFLAEKPKHVTISKNIKVNRTQNLRTKITKQICQKYGLDKDNNFKSLKASKRLKTVIVDDKHKILFCYLPKVASGNWKKIFLVLKGEFQDVNDIEPTVAHKEDLLKTLGNSTFEEIRKKIKTYESYVVVREPMSRLLSAYLNKIYYDYTGKFHRLFGEKITKYSGRIIGDRKVQNKISFAEFVEFLTKAPAKEAFEIHWERMHKLCNPCLINYTLIGRYENLLEDAQVIIESIVRKTSILFPTYTSVQDTSSLMESYFSQITERQLERLLSLYELDYLLFDYPKPVHLFKIVKKERNEELN